MGVKKAIIVDLDGTLCNDNHRKHFLELGQWDSYNKALIYDEPFEFCQQIINTNLSIAKIIFVTGRVEPFRELTQYWLKEKCGLNSGKYILLMRKRGDRRRGVEVKHSIYRNKIYGKYDIMFAVENNFEISCMWEEEGIPCLFCDEKYLLSEKHEISKLLG